jgi:hypothetical protein
MRYDTKDMQATSTASVKGHQMTVTQLDAYLASRQMHCSCGYRGMVRQNAKDAHGDVARHAYTVQRDAAEQRCYTSADPFGFPTMYPL